MKYRGRVAIERRGGRSKSARDAVVLQSDAASFVLRVQGGNAFSDPVLDALVGKTIEADGIVQDGVLIVNRWRELE